MRNTGTEYMSGERTPTVLPEMAELTLKDAFQESLCIDTRAQIFFELGKIELVFYKNYDEAKEFFNKCTVKL